MGEICMWENKGPTIYDPISTYDPEKIVAATAGIELLQKLAQFLRANSIRENMNEFRSYKSCLF